MCSHSLSDSKVLLRPIVGVLEEGVWPGVWPGVKLLLQSWAAWTGEKRSF
jgi:hypothetical protein